MVGQMAALRGFCEEDVQFIILAVDKACANIIRHAYKGSHDRPIIISCNEREDGIEFLLVDQGEPADANRWHRHSLDEVRPGGFTMKLFSLGIDEVENPKWGR